MAFNVRVLSHLNASNICQVVREHRASTTAL